MYPQSTSHCKQNRQHRPHYSKSALGINIDFVAFLLTVDTEDFMCLPLHEWICFSGISLRRLLSLAYLRP